MADIDPIEYGKLVHAVESLETKVAEIKTKYPKEIL